MSVLELTLGILKPHITKNPYALREIQNIILTSNFKIVRYKRKTISMKEAEDFYADHKGKFFFNRLVTFMTSGPSDLLILAKQNAIRDWRTLMGPTKAYRAQFEAPESIRGKFGLSDTRNATHGSDSEESAKREIKVFFPEFDIDRWYREQECFFRENKLTFCRERYVHQPTT